MVAPSRQWTADQLARMKSAVESGVQCDIVAVRFQCSVRTVRGLAGFHGWALPKQRVAPPPKPKRTRHGSFFLKANSTPFQPKEGGCPCRTLQGAELTYWKNIYESRDRAERARAQSVEA